jgi:putative flippase GtrA
VLGLFPCGVVARTVRRDMTTSKLTHVFDPIAALRTPAGQDVRRQFLRYGIVAGLGYLLAVSAYSGELVIGVPPYVALGIAFVLNGLFNFAMLRVWAFPSSGRSAHSDLLRFCLVAAGSFLVNYATFAVLYSAIGLAAVTAQRVGILVAAPVTFLGNRAWSFRTRSQAQPHDGVDIRASVRKDSYSRM